jgi:hypothetical protein
VRRPTRALEGGKRHSLKKYWGKLVWELIYEYLYRLISRAFSIFGGNLNRRRILFLLGNSALAAVLAERSSIVRAQAIAPAVIFAAIQTGIAIYNVLSDASKTTFTAAC